MGSSGFASECTLPSYAKLGCAQSDDGIELRRSPRACFNYGPAVSTTRVLPPVVFSGWVNRQQQAVIDYLLEENRVFRASDGPRGYDSPTISDVASP